MPKTPAVSRAEIEPDLEQIAKSLMKIESPQSRYWVTFFVDLIAEGYVAVDKRTLDFVGRGAERGSRLRDVLADQQPKTAKSG